MEERISKSKVRQLEAKNEEYPALENEIQSLTELNSSKEDEQIDILVKIDGAQVAKIAQDKIVKKVKDLEVQKLKFEDRITEMSEVKNLEYEIKDARQSVDEAMLRTYDRIKSCGYPSLHGSPQRSKMFRL